MRVKLLFAVLAAFFLQGCATITQGNDQKMTVNTDPQGASCTLKRDGGEIAVVSPTPGTAEVEKSKDDIVVRCEKSGRQPGQRTVSSDFEGMTAGNLVFGGVVGLGVDAASGAMNEYPSQVTLMLPPKEFPDDASEKRYFERRRQEIREDASEAISKIEENCGDPAEKDKCAKAVQRVEAERDARLKELRRYRDNAEVSQAQ